MGLNRDGQTKPIGQIGLMLSLDGPLPKYGFCILNYLKKCEKFVTYENYIKSKFSVIYYN